MLFPISIASELHFFSIAFTLERVHPPSIYPSLPQSQVPLVVFKREKEIARKLEFDGLYITEQPSDEDIKGQWDRMVINTP